jgi:glucose-1-phosphate cytidylyltransferase
LRDETFMLTYGDGIANIDPNRLIAFHRQHGSVATITAVRPPARFGGLTFDGHMISRFTEKPQIGEGWINGGFMVCEPEIMSFIESDHTSLEADVMEQLSSRGLLAAYRHEDFWQCMDTLRDVRLLQSLWQAEAPPWKVWS